jgi:16S rRNA processing protein RimM
VPARLDIGAVIRPHGLRGHVVVELWTNRPERLAPGALLEGPAGELRVDQASPLTGSGGGARWLVAFAGVDTHEGAERMRGWVLRAAPLEVEGALWIHEMIGAEVVDPTGEKVGVVAAVEANPASDLLVLEDGRLIPLNFIEKQDGGRLTVIAPPGLLDP